MPEKIAFCWSGGKDSSYALNKILEEGSYEVEILFTTVSSEYKRVSMHGVQEELIKAQADSIGLSIEFVYIEESTSHDEYENKMKSYCLTLKERGIHKVAFGDIFLEDLKQYRVDQMSKVGMEAIFPIWKMSTKEIIKDFVKQGFQSYTCCVGLDKLKEDQVGTLMDDEFFNNLPEEVDPCGENGEFHSFVFNAPMFQYPLSIELGETLMKTYKHEGKEFGFAFKELNLLDLTNEN